MYFRICPYCNANLDPGEQCDCMKKSRPSDSNPKGGAGNQNGFPKTTIYFNKMQSISQVQTCGGK